MREIVHYHVLHETLTTLILTPERLVSQYYGWYTGIAGGGNGFGGSSVGALQFLSWPKPAAEVTSAQQQQPPHLSQTSQVHQTSHSLFSTIRFQVKKGGLEPSKTR